MNNSFLSAQHTIYKYHSLGNDIIIIDCPSQQWWSYIQTCVQKGFCKEAQLLLHRQRGIGADCLLVWQSNNQQDVHAFIFNADGSYGHLCVNGARCFAAHCDQYYHRDSRIYPFFMGSYMLTAQVLDNQYGIAVRYGKIVAQEHKIMLGDKVFCGALVDVGNPHYLISVDSYDQAYQYAQQYGHQLSTHVDFPVGMNVSFYVRDVIDSKRKFVVTYERGCGLTYACGSAVCAIATLLRDTFSYGELYTFSLRGGDCVVVPTVNQVTVYAPVCAIIRGNIADSYFSSSC